ncbi:Ribonuclease H-like superfamily [Sesbania bispinosa]|nr:Ribonuclease H-like superfamily [Sesbania bispinosa]
MSFVYGNPIPNERRSLWYEIDRCHFHNGLEWSVLGDFNEVLHPYGKEGLCPCNMGMVQLFRDFVNQAGLLDMELKGNTFTWFSNPRRGVVVMEKLDRVLTNWPWREMFPNAIATALLDVSSDHSPIVLDTDPQEGSGTHFKDENGVWVEGKKRISEAIVRHFQTIFTASKISHVDECLAAVDNIVTQEMNDRLCLPIRDEEIKRAVNELGSLKAPGPDGLNGLFYKSHWEEIKAEVLESIKSFFNGDPLLQPVNEMGLNQGNNLKVADLLSPGARRCDIRKIGEMFPHEIAQKIIQMPIWWGGEEDTFYWPYDKTGNFTVRSAYHVGRSEREHNTTPQASFEQIDKENWKWIWRVKCPHKIKLFLWRVCTDSLPVLDNLHRRNITDSPICPICGLEPETTEHALFNCSWVPPIWFGSRLQWNFDGHVSKGLMSGFHRRSRHEAVWRPPLQNVVKVNVDASWFQDRKGGALALVARDSLGAVLVGSALHYLAPSPVVAEALAVREGMILANNLGFQRILLESDCLHVVSSCRNDLEIGEVKGIVEDILAYRDRFSSCGFLWTHRSGNQLAHELAKAAASDSLPRSWVSQPPPQIRAILNRDAALARSESLHRFRLPDSLISAV